MNTVGPRLAKAHSFLDTAKNCLETRDWDSAASQAYYAAYHASAAFLEWHLSVPQKPSEYWHEKEIRAGLTQHFVADVERQE
jgi:HEPN domain